MGRSSWNYYSVKLVLQAIVTGEPIEERIDDTYSGELTFFEESIVLVKAQSFEHAYAIAEKKAHQDRDRYTNMYGQAVEWQLVDAIDCFLIGEDPRAGLEVYSSITPAAKTVSARDYLENTYQYNLEDYEENWQRTQKKMDEQTALRYEQFSKWRQE